ncbi:MAG TPA: hypothetical protein VF361_09470 [Candidatus Limnocylindrales bacterium]
MPTQDRRGRGDGVPRRRPAAAKTSHKLAADAVEQPVPEDMTADLESQAADFMADNDAWMYGPNAPTVLEILDRLEEMGPEEARPLAQAWQAAPKEGRESARKIARKLAEDDEEILRHLGLAREQVGSWVAVKADYPPYRDAEPDWARLCAQAGEATLDALTSVILESQLSRSDRAALFEPWLQAVASLPAGGTGEAADGGAAGDLTSEDEEDEEDDEGKYGPNSAAVADFLNRLWLLAPEQVARLVSGWERTPREALDLAHESLLAVVDEDPEWRDQVRRAQDQLVLWLNGGRLEDASGFMGDSGHTAFRKMAGPALADAVAALVLGDLLFAEDAMTLYGPWFNLVGAPELALAEDVSEGEGEDRDKS